MPWITPIATNYSEQYERAENLETNSRAALMLKSLQDWTLSNARCIYIIGSVFGGYWSRGQLHYSHEPQLGL
jgi:predicted esterase YcpF (UPF0227 family)